MTGPKTAVGPSLQSLDCSQRGSRRRIVVVCLRLQASPVRSSSTYFTNKHGHNHSLLTPQTFLADPSWAEAAVVFEIAIQIFPGMAPRGLFFLSNTNTADLYSHLVFKLDESFEHPQQLDVFCARIHRIGTSGTGRASPTCSAPIRCFSCFS